MEQNLVIIGEVISPLKTIEDCALQENENAPEALLNIDEKYAGATKGLKVGNRIVILTWLHKADRDTLTTQPRNNKNAAFSGVFATRSPDRPNPIGLHVADIIAIENCSIKISNLEVLNGTPIIDIKPYLGK